MKKIALHKPNCLILGSAKCGTTSLYHYLKQHPDICFSKPKEPVFFEAEYELGMEYYWQTYFAHWAGEQVVGEARQRNMYLPFVAERIAQSVPDAKLIIILRNPVERAFSHWLGRYRSGKESLPFAEAILHDLDRIKQGFNFEGEVGARLWKDSMVPAGSPKGKANSALFATYVDSGYYSDQIKRYLKLFNPQQMRILFLDDLVRDPHAVIQSLFDFLGVDASFRAHDIEPQNVTAQKPSVRQALFTSDRLSTPQCCAKWRWLLRRLITMKADNRLRMKRSTQRFLSEHYRPYNLDLENITGRSLISWWS